MNYPSIDTYKNIHGLWRIERLSVKGKRPRYTLWRWVSGLNKWMLIANQGRRKTCIELADANYGLDQVTILKEI